MGTLILAVTTLLLYSIATSLQALAFRGKLATDKRASSWLGLLALTSHAALAWELTWKQSGVDLGLFPASVVISALVVGLLLLISWQKKPLQSLFLIVYPLAALTIIASLTFDAPPHNLVKPTPGLMVHIVLSVTGYSLLTLAALQAVLVIAQNYRLKHNYNSLLVRNLPPLQTMESLLFDLVWAGIVLLTLAIISGAMFMEDLFAQHLAHKTVFSLLAWLVFAALLAGRQVRGWRGLTAARWTLLGCALLMIGYYGSKFVLEIVFNL